MSLTARQAIASLQDVSDWFANEIHVGDEHILPYHQKVADVIGWLKAVEFDDQVRNGSQQGIPWEDLPDDGVVDLTAAFQREAAQYNMEASHGRVEISRRLEARGGTAMQSNTVKAFLKRKSPTYDVQKLHPLIEVLHERDLVRVYAAAHKETIDVPAKWNGTQLRRIEREYGGDVAARIDDARVEGDQYLVIEEIA